MIPVALARKYRPQSFPALVGQEAIARTVQNAIRSGRIHSAYLFAGTRGVGKTTTARLLAKSLNCRQGPTIDPCGECDNCIEIAEGRSVDVQEIDAASHTKVEETRELLGRVAYAPAKGKYRVFIIDEAHMLSKSSFNALLKTLEEPPPHAVFVLATTEPQKILDTVRSRCIEFAFRRIPAARIAENLAAVLGQEGIDFEPAALERISLEADGSMRDALSLTDQVLGYAEAGLDVAAVEAALGLTGKATVARVLDAILARDPAALQGLYREAYRGGADLRRLGIDLIGYLRELILLRSTGATPEPGYLADSVVASEAWSLSDLHRMFDRLHRALVDLERSPVPDVLLETVLLRLSVLEPLGSLEELWLSGGGGAGGAATAGSGGPRAAAPAAGGVRAEAPVSAPSAPVASAATGGEAPVAAVASPAVVPPAPSRTASDSARTPVAGGDVVRALIDEIPSLRPMLEGLAEWQAPLLQVRLPSGREFAAEFLESRREEIETVLRRVADPAARLELRRDEAPSEVAAALPAAPPTRDKRRMLEDEKIRLVLEAFPGAEVVDIRWSQ